MPSQFRTLRFEPDIRLRYGTIPIVRVTGGLDDSVTDLTENIENADGIKFREYSVRALAKAIRKALVLYGEKDLLQHFQHNGMAKDFSWDRTAAAYERVYLQTMEVRAKEPNLLRVPYFAPPPPPPVVAEEPILDVADETPDDDALELQPHTPA